MAQLARNLDWGDNKKVGLPVKILSGKQKKNGSIRRVELSGAVLCSGNAALVKYLKLLSSIFIYQQWMWQTCRELSLNLQFPSGLVLQPAILPFWFTLSALINLVSSHSRQLFSLIISDKPLYTVQWLLKSLIFFWGVGGNQNRAERRVT